MSEFRQRAIEDVARAMGVDAEDVVFYMRPGASSSKLATYAVARQERVLGLEAASETAAVVLEQLHAAVDWELAPPVKSLIADTAKALRLRLSATEAQP